MRSYHQHLNQFQIIYIAFITPREFALTRLTLILRLLGFFGVLGFTPLLLPQEGAREEQGKAVLSGVVIDASGAVIRGASVLLSDLNAHGMFAESEQTSSALGRFTYHVLPGRYVLNVRAPGFAAFERRPIVLVAGGPVEITARLAVENLQQEIDVPNSVASSTDPDQNADALVFEGKSLDLLSSDNATFQQQLQSLAGSIGAPTFLINGFSGGKLPSKSSIRSVRINQNPFSSYFAEYGSGRVEITTQPGGDSLHGSLTFSGTDQVLDARNPYTSVKPNFYDFEQDGSVGGPIGKKTSYFFSDTVEQLANSSVVNAADPASPLTQISTAVASPQLSQVYALRSDRKFSDRNFGFLREEWSDTRLSNGGISPLILPDAAFFTRTLTSTVQASDTQILGSHSVNEVRFQYLRTRLRQDPNTVLPSIVVQGSFQSGGVPTQFLRDRQDAYEAQDVYQTEHAHHSVHAGLRMRALRDSNWSNAGFNGQYIFPNVTAYLAGTATQYSQTFGEPGAVLLMSDLGVFAEDDWKVKPTLTLSYGLRFESQSAIPDHSDPAPRVAFAWAVQPGKRLKPLVTVRGGYGLFYDRFPAAQLLQSIRQNGTRQVAYYAQNTSFDPAGPPPGVSLAAGEPTIYEVNPRLKTSYTQASSASVERGFGRYGSVSANFLYAHDTHVPLTRNLNAPLPGTVTPGDPGSGIRPLGPENLYAFSADANGNLERFYLNFRVQPVSRLLLFGVLAAQKNYNETDGITNFPSNEYDLRQDYGRSGLNRAAWFTGGLRWQAPYGIQVSPYLNIHSGLPFNITTGDDRNGDTIYNDRPGLSANASSASVVSTLYGKFDVSPFAGEALVGRNSETAPGYLWLQLQLSKDVHVGPRPKVRGATERQPAGASAERPWDLNFAVEVHNLTNHNNPGLPVGVLSAQTCDSSGAAACVCAEGVCPLVPSTYFGHSLSLANDFSPVTASNRTLLLQTTFSW